MYQHGYITPLERYTTTDEKGAVKDFWGLWTHAGKDEIAWMGFDLSKNVKSGIRKISGVTLVTKDGERYTVPAHVFRTVFGNVTQSKKPGTDIATGFEFAVPGGKRASIHPGKTLDDVAEIMKEVRIDGKGLSTDVKFFMGDDFQRGK